MHAISVPCPPGCDTFHDPVGCYTLHGPVSAFFDTRRGCTLQKQIMRLFFFSPLHVGRPSPACGPSSSQPRLIHSLYHLCTGVKLAVLVASPPHRRSRKKSSQPGAAKDLQQKASTPLSLHLHHSLHLRLFTSSTMFRLFVLPLLLLAGAHAFNPSVGKAGLSRLPPVGGRQVRAESSLLRPVTARASQTITMMAAVGNPKKIVVLGT